MNSSSKVQKDPYADFMWTSREYASGANFFRLPSEDYWKLHDQGKNVEHIWLVLLLIIVNGWQNVFQFTHRVALILSGLQSRPHQKQFQNWLSQPFALIYGNNWDLKSWIIHFVAQCPCSDLTVCMTEVCVGSVQESTGWTFRFSHFLEEIEKRLESWHQQQQPQ